MLALAMAGCGSGSSNTHPEVVLGAKSQDQERRAARIDGLKTKIEDLRGQRAGRPVEVARASDVGTAALRGEGDLLDEADARSFHALADRLGGELGLAVGRVGSPDSQLLGTLISGPAWSTIKVPIAAAVLETAGGSDGASAADRSLVTRALTASDNEAAASLWDKLSAANGGVDGAAAAVESVLGEAGDRTRISVVGRAGFSPYGQTQWALVDQYRFISMLAAACSLPAQIATYLLNEMGNVIPSQRWGMGAAGVPASFKGGWGPGVDGRYLVRQMGVFEVEGEQTIAVAIVARTPDGRFESATGVLTELARWTAEAVRSGGVSAGRRSCPSG